MPQISLEAILQRVISGQLEPCEGIPGLVDRTAGRFGVPEGQLVDYKEGVEVDGSSAVAELARDVLGFSNSDGGILVLGVANDGQIIGATPE